MRDRYTAGSPQGPPSYPSEGDTRIRYFVDGEATASIDMALYLGHGIGFNDQRAPWDAGHLMGKSGTTLAIWNTFKIPFAAGVRVELSVPAYVNVSAPEHYYVIIRGAAFDPAAAGAGGYPWPTLGGWRLPPTARLRLLATERAMLQPLDTLGLVQLPAGRAGALLLTVLQVLSGNANFLEGCVRASWNGGEPELVSSGTEDYFGSSFYFDGVPDGFKSPNSGLTHLVSNDTALEFSAYKVHGRGRRRVGVVAAVPTAGTPTTGTRSSGPPRRRCTLRTSFCGGRALPSMSRGATATSSTRLPARA